MRQIVLVVACLGLTSCATNNIPYLSLLKQTLGGAYQADDSKLNPVYRYLRVTISSRASYVLLGDIDKNLQGDVEIFYSGGGEVLRFQHGRLAGATGTLTEWRNVSLHDVPSWSSAADTGKTSTWRRVRDVMPGYRYNLGEQVTMQRIPPPKKSALVGMAPEKLAWFEEHIDAMTDNYEKLPPARYAVSFESNHETVVYGEQCLSIALCLAWQQWPPRKK